MIVPCGLSSPRTKRPFAKLRAFSSSSGRHRLVHDARSSADDRRDRVVDPVDVDAGLRGERARVRVASVDAAKT